MNGAEVDVDVATLDDVASDVLERVSLVKLDVEGAELRALRGATELLHRARPDFIVELEPGALRCRGLRRLLDLRGEARATAARLGSTGRRPEHRRASSRALTCGS